jgi:hypothetical protein
MGVLRLVYLLDGVQPLGMRVCNILVGWHGVGLCVG